MIGLEMYTIVKFEYHLQFGICNYVMFLWGVAVFKLDSHPDHIKGPDP